MSKGTLFMFIRGTKMEKYFDSWHKCWMGLMYDFLLKEEKQGFFEWLFTNKRKRIGIVHWIEMINGTCAAFSVTCMS